MKRILILALLAFMIVGCDKSRGMETQTFQLVRLSPDEALALLTPYIHEGGYLSAKGKLITVRDRQDRLTLIADLLKKYDGSGEALDVLLNIQVIQANGFTEKDPAIADVEGTLREMFKYQGYKLIGSTQIRSREDQMFAQRTDAFSIRGGVQRVRVSEKEQRVPISIELNTKNSSLESTVTATIGKPVVVGQSVGDGAIILVIRPTLAK